MTIDQLLSIFLGVIIATFSWAISSLLSLFEKLGTLITPLNILLVFIFFKLSEILTTIQKNNDSEEKQRSNIIKHLLDLKRENNNCEYNE